MLGALLGLYKSVYSRALGLQFICDTERDFQFIGLYRITRYASQYPETLNGLGLGECMVLNNPIRKTRGNR